MAEEAMARSGPFAGVRVVEFGRFIAGAEEEQLIAFCRDRLASFKCRRTVDFLPSLPREESGKLKKRLLRDPYWRDHAGQRAATPS